MNCVFEIVMPDLLENEIKERNGELDMKRYPVSPSTCKSIN